MDYIRREEMEDKGFRVLRLWESEIKTMNIEKFIEEIKKTQESIFKKKKEMRLLRDE